MFSTVVYLGLWLTDNGRLSFITSECLPLHPAASITVDARIVDEQIPGTKRAEDTHNCRFMEGMHRALWEASCYVIQAADEAVVRYQR